MADALPHMPVRGLLKNGVSVEAVDAGLDYASFSRPQVAFTADCARKEFERLWEASDGGDEAKMEAKWQQVVAEVIPDFRCVTCLA